MSKTIREWLEQLPEPSYVDEFDRPAEQPTAFPDELSVARTNITKLVAENARLERENARLAAELAEARKLIDALNLVDAPTTEDDVK